MDISEVVVHIETEAQYHALKSWANKHKVAYSCPPTKGSFRYAHFTWKSTFSLEMWFSRTVTTLGGLITFEHFKFLYMCDNKQELKAPTKEAVLKAAAECPTAGAVLKKLFPEAFEEDLSVDIISNGPMYDKNVMSQPNLPLLTISTNRKKIVLNNRDFDWRCNNAEYPDKSIITELIPTRKKK